MLGPNAEVRRWSPALKLKALPSVEALPPGKIFSWRGPFVAWRLVCWAAGAAEGLSGSAAEPVKRRLGLGKTAGFIRQRVDRRTVPTPAFLR